MRVQQISVFLENKSGRLAAATRALGERGINIRALCIADTSDFGVLRLIVSDPEAARGALKEAGFVVRVTDVLAVEVSDEPGGLARVMDTLEKAGVNIEYLYAFCEKYTNNALVVFRVEDPDTAARALISQGIQVVSSQDVCRM